MSCMSSMGVIAHTQMMDRDTFDRNGDGVISEDEFADLLDLLRNKWAAPAHTRCVPNECVGTQPNSRDCGLARTCLVLTLSHALHLTNSEMPEDSEYDSDEKTAMI
jgi:hypothetical protein